MMGYQGQAKLTPIHGELKVKNRQSVMTGYSGGTRSKEEAEKEIREVCPRGLGEHGGAGII